MRQKYNRKKRKKKREEEEEKKETSDINFMHATIISFPLELVCLVC